jgi:diguanylate cyclase (GGDEF)-like protein
MPKSKKGQKLLPHNLDLVFSTFIEVTGLITTGASMARIVTPILACASDILAGVASFAILEQSRTFTRVSYTPAHGTSRPAVLEGCLSMTGLLRDVYRDPKMRRVAGLRNPKQVARITGLDGMPRESTVTVAGLQYRKSRIGMIGVVTPADALPDAQEMGLFELLARQAGIAIKNAREFDRTQTLSITDGLTGSYNYRFLVDSIRKEIGRADRFSEEFSIIMLDVDGLKEYNDVHGHLRGSAVIRSVAQIASQKLRSIDMLCKYGGDEFVVVLPRTRKEGAALAAERIRMAIDKHRFLGEKLTGKITASMGIASFPEDGGSVQELISNADKALYKAKRHGRNQVWISGRKRPYSGD